MREGIERFGGLEQQSEGMAAFTEALNAPYAESIASQRAAKKEHEGGEVGGAAEMPASVQQELDVEVDTFRKELLRHVQSGDRVSAQERIQRLSGVLGKMFDGKANGRFERDGIRQWLQTLAIEVDLLP